MTQDDLDLIARFCDGVTHHYDEDRARIRRLLDEHASLERDLAELREALAKAYAAMRARVDDRGSHESVAMMHAYDAVKAALLPAEPPKEASDGK